MMRMDQVMPQKRERPLDAGPSTGSSGERDPTTGRSAPLVLIVDDFEDNRAMYAEYLAFTGYLVEEASNGEEAVELARRLRPDAVVMDLSLPVMDGWEATRRLKADERTKHIPVIALTGHSLAGYSAGAKEAGCDAFLVKPCFPEKLVAKLAELALGDPAATKQ
jgi:two-component system cell cycle response regulator DivK